MMQKFRVNSIAMESGHYPGRQWMGQSTRLVIPSPSTPLRTGFVEEQTVEMTNDERRRNMVVRGFLLRHSSFVIYTPSTSLGTTV